MPLVRTRLIDIVLVGSLAAVSCLGAGNAQLFPVDTLEITLIALQISIGHAVHVLLIRKCVDGFDAGHRVSLARPAKSSPSPQKAQEAEIIGPQGLMIWIAHGNRNEAVRHEAKLILQIGGELLQVLRRELFISEQVTTQVDELVFEWMRYVKVTYGTVAMRRDRFGDGSRRRWKRRH